jgi:hypothetical protein
MEDYEEAYKRYMKAAHAMQSGVAFKMEKDPSETKPKHLRVGINSVLSNNAAIAELLIERGIFTKEDYMSKMADKMEEEAEDYRQELESLFGVHIELG